jgi:TetR/AcrR family transcriptional repressor of nem operon
MARPSKFNRQEAVALAMNEIWREGYKASSVKALSEKLGITRSSFYNAFGNREALFGEVLALYFSQAPDRRLADAPPGMSVKQLLTDTFRAVCKARSKDREARGCLAINCVAELCATNDELGPMLEDAVLKSVARLETLLGRGIANGELDGGADTHALALSLQNLLIGLNVLCKVVRQEADLWLVARTTLDGLGLLKEN